ncbi:MAG: hypothetical protein LBH43_11000 [Treponema sp.]|nr:hypothetical protein [Treponema sp.]
MVRKQETAQGGIEALVVLEKETEAEVKKYNDIRKHEFKDEMNAGFFFSVVFDTNKERDQWLKDRNLTLEEDFFIKIKDFKV